MAFFLQHLISMTIVRVTQQVPTTIEVRYIMSRSFSTLNSSIYSSLFKALPWELPEAAVWTSTIVVSSEESGGAGT